MSLTLHSILTGTQADGDVSPNEWPCMPIGNPGRSVGLSGDNIEIRVPRDFEGNDWPPEDWDLSKSIVWEFGYIGTGGDPSEIITLSLHLQQDTPITFGVDAGTPGASGGAGTSESQEHKLLLTSIMGKYADGRGGRLMERTFNPLNRNGRVDTGHADFIDAVDAAILCLTAMGFATGVVSTALNDPPPPGPLDWGNARAAHELDAICARAGCVPVLAYNDATANVVRLPKAGEPVTPPAWVTDAAEPYTLTQAAAIRAKTVIVTSGRTRTVEATRLSLASFEWVWRDPLDGQWLNDAETEARYAGSTKPGDINAWKAGPGTSDQSRAEFSRLFRALRVKNTVEDPTARARLSRLVAFPITAFDTETNQMARSACVIEAVAATRNGQGQLRNEPESSLAPQRFEGTRVHPLDGVIELPSKVAFVRVTGQRTGSYGDCAALAADDLRVTFGHEANNGVFLEDYYCAAFHASLVDDEVEVTQITDAGEIDDALADKDAVWIDAEFLRHFVSRDAVTGTVTTINGAELDLAATALAKVRAAADYSLSGIIECRGLLNKIPGVDWDACSAVEWDISRRRTILTINSAEVPQGFYDDLEANVERSIAFGLNRFGIASSSAAESDVRGGSGVGRGTPAWVGGAGGGSIAEPGASQTSRGAEEAIAHRASYAQRAEHDDGFQTGHIMARITGNTSVSANIWEYDWEEIRPQNNGVWQSSGSPRTSGTLGKARNLLEVGNTASGVQFNQTDTGEWCPGTMMRPIVNGTVAELKGPTGTDANPLWWFAIQNGPVTP